MTAAKTPVQPFRLKLHQKIPMRDGVNLSADIYLPHGEKRYPTLLLRTIYHSKEPRYIRWVVGFVKAGYAVVIQDTRGRHDSDGTWEPYTCEIPDGFDTHEWIGRQAWSDGKIGTFGISYPGFTQTCPAPDGSKHLAALVPIASQQDNFGHHRCDGLIAWANTVFFPNMVGRTMQTEAIATLDLAAIQNHLPLHSVWDDIADSPYVRGVIEHEEYGPYWSSYSLRHRYDKVDVPSYFMTGWYDSLLNETIKVFQGWKKKARSPEARKLTKIIIGPWGHQVAPWGKLTPDFHLGANGKFQDMICGPDAEGDIVQMHLRWYDARMKNAANGMDEEPALNLFIQGENVWRLEDQWPLKKTRWTDYYLHASGRLDTMKPTGTETPDTYRYDPKDPVPTWGGSYQMKELCGPRDRREIEKRKDVICYTTEPLAQDVEVTGPVTATIWASSSAVDTDFTASLIDVCPDGRALLLTDGICRARFRKAADGWKPEDLEKGIAPYERLYEPGFKPEMLTPNTPTEFKIDLWSTANLFKKGHRIRVEISSSNFPRYDRNMNTGGRVGFEAEGKVADQTIHHDADKPSRITLPVIPR